MRTLRHTCYHLKAVNVAEYDVYLRIETLGVAISTILVGACGDSATCLHSDFNWDFCFSSRPVIMLSKAT